MNKIIIAKKCAFEDMKPFVLDEDTRRDIAEARDVEELRCMYRLAKEYTCDDEDIMREVIYLCSKRKKQLKKEETNERRNQQVF